MKKTMLSIVMMLCFVLGYAQELPTIIPSSPEATQFKLHGDYPVNLSTGVPNIEVPIYTIETGGFKLPIKLQYHASGIKVSQEATWVGLGWNLSSGAQITLDVRDQPDEFNPSINSLPDENHILSNLENPDFLASEKPFYLNNSWVKDVYNVSAPTVNGKFYKNFSGDIIVFPPDAFQVEEGNGSAQDPYFTITDKTGNIYKFNNVSDGSSKETTSISGENSSKSYTSAWYVNEIITPQKNRISFTYQDDGFTSSKSKTHIFRHIYTYNPLVLHGWDEGALHDERVSTNLNGSSLSTTNVKKIKEIKFDKGRVVFDLLRDRKDISSAGSVNPGRLKFIRVDALEDENYKTVKSYSLQHSYFKSGLTAPSPSNTNEVNNYYRLKLDGVRDMLSGDKETNFTYHNPDNLELKNSNSKDFWGYPNDNPPLGSLIPMHKVASMLPVSYSIEVGGGDRNVKKDASTTGLLSSIKYPTKGLTKFIYESNSYEGDCKTKVAVGQGSLAGLGNPSILPKELAPGIDTGIYICNDSNSSACAQSGYYDFNLTVQDNYTLKYSFWSDNGALSNNILDEQEDKYGYVRIRLFSLADGSLIYDSGKWSEWNKTMTYYKEIQNLHPGSYRVTLSGYGYNRSVQNFDLHRFEEFRCNKLGPGSRIKKIENYDNNNSLVLTKSYGYNYTDSNLSSGVFVGNRADKDFMSKFNRNYTSKCVPDLRADKPVQYCDYIITTSYTINSSSINASGANSIEYRSVIEKQDGINEKRGYTKHEFSTAHDYQENNSIIYVKLGWLRGNLLKKESFKVRNNDTLKVFKEENTFVNDDRKKALVEGFKFFEYKTYSSYNDYANLGHPGFEGAYEPVFYKYNIDWHYKKRNKTTSYFYDSSNNLKDSLVTTTNYFYDNIAHLQQTRVETINSNNEALKTETKYAHDVNDTRLLNEHRIAEPLETKSYRDLSLLNWQKTVYDSLHNPSNLYLPSKIKTSKGSSALEDRVVYHAYDDKGNPIEVSKKDGTKIYYVWGYQQTQPIAKIEGYTASQLASAQTVINNAIAASNNDSDLVTENTLREALSSLRASLPDSQVTTFTYNLLIGVTSITDPRGDTIYYEYDYFNRLKFVKDSDGNILKENKYKYKD